MLFSIRKTDVKLSNMVNVLQCVLIRQVTTKPEIAKELGLSLPTASSLVDEMIEHRFLRFSGTGASTESGGKRPKLISLNLNGRHLLAIHIDVEGVEAALVDLQATVKFRSRRRIEKHENQEQITAKVTGLTEDLFGQAKREGYSVLGIGVTMAGIVDPVTGISRLSSNFSTMNGLPIRDILKQYEIPVWVDNECRGLALAEKWFGLGKDCGDFISLFTDFGIGAGFVIHGDIARGTDYSFGEIGHLTIQMDGPLCNCGNRGCWESFASSKALLQAVGERLAETRLLGGWVRDGQPLTIDLISRAVREGDEVVKEIAIVRLGMYLAVGLANLVNTFNPEHIFLYGQIRGLGSELLAEVRKQVSLRSLPIPSARVLIEFSEFGDEGALIGAAALALKEAIHQPELLLLSR